MPKTTKAAKTSKATATANRSKANATRTAQPGIISAIMHLLVAARDKSKPATYAQMHTALCKKFADREPSGIAITLRAQLSRLPNERAFGIDKQRDGVIVFYSAASDARANSPKVAAA